MGDRDAGTPEDKLSLPPSSGPREYNEYVVSKSFFADSGNAAPYYGKPGGGRRFFIGRGFDDPSDNPGPDISVDTLLKWGFLTEKK